MKKRIISTIISIVFLLSGTCFAMAGETEQMQSEAGGITVAPVVKAGDSVKGVAKATVKKPDSKKEKKKIIVRPKRPRFTLKCLKNGIYIKWKKVKNAKAYVIYRKKPGGKYKKLARVISSGYHDLRFGNRNGIYGYYVKAVNSKYESTYKKKTIRYTHRHTIVKEIVREATKYKYGIKKYYCKNCKYSNKVILTPISVGRYMLDDFESDLQKAESYEIKSLDLRHYENRTAIKPVTKITAPRYMMDKDGIYKRVSGESDGTATIMLTGDSMCQPRQIKTSYAKYHKYRFDDEFSAIRSTLTESDFAVTNLETMLSDSSAFSNVSLYVNGVYHCNGPSTFLGGLRYAGFDMTVTANNHNCDTGVRGLFETLTHLDQYGFIHTGMFRNESEERYKIVEIDGIKVAFVSYTTSFNKKNLFWTDEGQDVLLNKFSEEKVKRDVAAAKSKGAEYVIGYIHTGKCFVDYTTDVQENAFQTMADAGIDYIVGAHPHVLQKYKTVKSADGRTVPVMCSLGNFVSHMQQTPERHLSAVLQIELKRDKKGKVYRAKQGYIPIKTYSTYEDLRYVVVPMTSPYNTESLSFDANAEEHYETIVNAIGNKIKAMGEFAE